MPEVSNQPRWMIYGATGYTGRLIAQQAVTDGLRPILAGRDGPSVRALATELDLEARELSLNNPTTLAESLVDVEAVLHCAGPFAHTWQTMVEGCLATGTHYLDITGEISVFESIHRRHREATGGGVVLLPGVGFDVVPSDCLAKRLSESLPDATDLRLAFTTAGASTSRGTRKTMLEGLPGGGAIRRDGKILQVPFAHDVDLIHFSCGPRNAMTIGWGDVSTAFYSTGIPNIRVYTGIRQETLRKMRILVRGAPLMKHRIFRRIAEALIDRSSPGPSPEQRRNGRAYFWGRVRNSRGQMRTATLEIPEGYTFTSTTALESVRRVLQGLVQPGFSTPSKAFGADYLEDFPDVQIGAIETGRRQQAD